jgi:hypothetical protein
MGKPFLIRVKVLIEGGFPLFSASKLEIMKSVGESMGFSGRIFGSMTASSMKLVNYLGCRLSGFWAGRRWGS